MWVRRFGILWRASEYSLYISILICRVCAKLHNHCVDYNEEMDIVEESHNDSDILNGSEHPLTGRNLPDDEEIMRDVTNYRVPLDNLGQPVRSKKSEKRNTMRIKIKSYGLMYESKHDYFALSKQTY